MAGTLLTATAHIITAVIGSGVLSLAWAMAQLGWVIGLPVLVSFSLITWFCSTLQADCYRSPHPVYGKRNYTYMDAARTNLRKKLRLLCEDLKIPFHFTILCFAGGVKVQLCGLVQYVNLVGVSISYAITTATSMA